MSERRWCCCKKIPGIAVLMVWGGCFVLQAQATGPEDAAMSSLRREYAALQAATDAHGRALHGYRLNDAAETYADVVNHAESRRRDASVDSSVLQAEAEPKIAPANRYGAGIVWCEVNADWTARPDGYLAYLMAWPDGPYAEEAWWRGKLDHRLTSCMDAEGSEEETAGLVADYTEFLKHFPHGRHEKEARRLLSEFQADLESYKRDKSSRK